MQRVAALCFALMSLTCFTGCPRLSKLTNNGPNTVSISSNPDPVDPVLPLDVAPGDTVTIKWNFNPVTVFAVDRTTNKFDVFYNLNLARGGWDSFIEIEWTGTELIDHGPQP